MTNLNKLIGSLGSSGAVTGFAGGLAGSVLGGALVGKKGRKMAGTALKYGAAAAVGGLAYSAYQRYQQDAPAENPPESAWQGIGEERFVDAIGDGSGSNGLLLVRAMIAAGNADGHLDSDEQSRIFTEVGRMNLSSADKALLFDELTNPRGIAEIARQASSPELAAEVYAASLIAIDETTADAHLYLRALALALDLPKELVTSIHEEASHSRTEGRAA